MCLSNPKGPFVAGEDIVCYKNILMTVSEKELAKAMDNLDSVKFSGIICDDEVSGLLVKDNEEFYFFQNQYCGNKPISFRTINHNYEYSWVLDKHVKSISIILSDSLSIVIPNKYLTSIRKANIEIGNSYESKIEFKDGDIEKALHSYVNIANCEYHRDRGEIKVKCIIPKGSIYYIGTYGICDSYASNQLKYIEIINE